MISSERNPKLGHDMGMAASAVVAATLAVRGFKTSGYAQLCMAGAGVCAFHLHFDKSRWRTPITPLHLQQQIDPLEGLTGDERIAAAYSQAKKS